MKKRLRVYNDSHMPFSDVFIVLRFWGALFFIGAASYPLTKYLFPRWYDRGYLFSKAVGMALVTWVVYVLGLSRLATFRVETIIAVIVGIFVIGIVVTFRKNQEPPGATREHIYIFLRIALQEIFFLTALFLWTWVKAHEPSIRGLEKFMDYGFMQSIVNSRYFPPLDMWYPPYPVNYYYFGHLVTALLTKLSGIDLAYTFNLMLAAIFAFTLTMSFSIGYQLIHTAPFAVKAKKFAALFSGVLTAFLVTMAGNMQTIYAFTKGYTGDDVVPFWHLWWNAAEFWSRLPEGIERYWYANATRFIPYTIHEFPSYSFVVSDVHGHVLSIPFVLLAIAILIHLFGSPKEGKKAPLGVSIFYGFLVGVLLMTNALDGPIYTVLFVSAMALFVMGRWSVVTKKQGKIFGFYTLVTLGSAVITSMPFLAHFKSFVNGIAVNCPLPFVANTKLGPILFEGVEKCQRSELWMLWLLWGFFVYCAVGLIVAVAIEYKKRDDKKTLMKLDIAGIWNTRFTQSEKVLMLLFIISILLLVFPELFYFKDIYPQHFRSNTMFKLGYQAFIMMSIIAGYVISRFLFVPRSDRSRAYGIFRKLFLILLIPQLILVSIYPLFSVRSYFGGLKRYEGIYGMNWLATEYPDDYEAIMWFKGKGIGGREGILVEADGDSYTDNQRFSVFTGIATPIGWAVHEWLWRGTYDVVSPRREDVRQIYESPDPEFTRELLSGYGVRFVVVGALERKKFTALAEEKFAVMGIPVFQKGQTVIYEITN